MLKVEMDVVRAIINLLRGDAAAVGHLTTGGTESIILAVKTARDKARAERPEITQPEMSIPDGARFVSQGSPLPGVKPVCVEIDPRTFRVRPEEMAAAITDNTVLLVASAPSYSQGVVDPIRDIAAIALQRNIPLHVDACVGGVHLSVMRQMGHELPDFDFSIPGVTSISTDLHKFGYAAKGCSVIMYRNKELRKYQLFACTETTCYTLINTTVLSSKSGGPMAGAWATLNYLGQEGYRRIVQTVQQATQQLIEGINAIPGLQVLGEPAMSMFSFASDSINVFVLADEMAKRGWFLQPQFTTPLTPRNLHVSVNYGTAHNVQALLADLRECVEIVKREDKIDRQAVQAMVAQRLAAWTRSRLCRHGCSGGPGRHRVAQRTAAINEIMDALPPQLCNQFLINFSMICTSSVPGGLGRNL